MSWRVALISDHASPLACLGGVDAGGQNVYVGQVARHLASFGHQVDVYTRRDAGHLPETVDFCPGVRVMHVPAGPACALRKETLLPFMDDFARHMLTLMDRRGHYDIVHANFFMSGLAAAKIKRAAGVPFVVTFHALGRVRRHYQKEADGFPSSRPLIEERVAAEADGVIAECPQDYDDLVRHCGAEPSKTAIIPCGVDPGELWPVGKRRARLILGLDPDEKIVLQVGRLVPRKGIDNVVRGFARFAKGFAGKSRLLIVGGNAPDPDPRATPEIARLSRIAAEEGVAGRVTFTGSRSRAALRLYYSAADVFVTTPWYEPFGITPLEAMACGTPVIASCVGGLKFSVVDGETGFLVPPKNPEALAERLAALLSSSDLTRSFSRAGLARARRSFTWDTVCREVERFFQETLERDIRPYYEPLLDPVPLRTAL
jgi:D-inositol-3-phosphate glycosyltransferase